MSIIHNLLSSFGLEKKSAADNSLSIFVPEARTGLSLANRKKITTVEEAYRAHELVFSCINKTADVMNDAEIIVEKKNAEGEWERVEGHLLSALFKRPNQYESGRDFRRLMVQSELSQGIFYAELVRSNAEIIVEMYPLNPAKVQPKLNQDRSGVAYYEYTNGSGQKKYIKRENMLIRRRVDLINRFFGFAPLAVALKTINSDVGLTDYVDAFFESDGTPSGILKILNATVSDAKREELQAKWKMKYSRGGSNQKGVAVLDQNVDYQKIGSNLDELATDSLSDRFESRICSPFGVPPILVGALVGLKHTTANATMKSALRDFWDNKISPELAIFREWLTWFLLPEFESIDLIKAEKIRVGFDISQAAFLQDDVDKIHARAQGNLKAGFWTVNEARILTGLPPDPEGDYYLQPFGLVALSPENRAAEAVQKVEQGKETIEPKTPATGEEGEQDDAEKVKMLSVNEKCLCVGTLDKVVLCMGCKSRYGLIGKSGVITRKEQQELKEKFDSQKELDEAAKKLYLLLNNKDCKCSGLIDSDPCESCQVIMEPAATQKKTKKSVEYNGLTLAREPRGVELVINLKSLIEDFTSERQKVAKILTKFRNELIDEAAKNLEDLSPETAYTLALSPNTKTRKQISKVLFAAYKQGRKQIIAELNAQKTAKSLPANLETKDDLDDDDFDGLDEITDLTVAKIINEIGARAVNWYISLKTLGNYTIDKLKEKLSGESLKFIEQQAGNSVNASIRAGRIDEIKNTDDEWHTLEYSAILDVNTCSTCEDADGQTAESVDDLPDAPNPDCEGGDKCRCFIVAIAD